MFSQFYDFLFPKFGDYIGMLVHLADMPFVEFIDVLAGNYTAIFYINVFDGSTNFFTNWADFLPFGSILRSFISLLFSPLKLFANSLGIGSYSSYLVLLMFSGTIFIAIAGIRLLRNLF